MYPQQYPPQYPPQPGQYPYGGAPYYQPQGYPPAPQQGGAFGGAPGQMAPQQMPRQPLAQWNGGEAFSPSRPKRTNVSFKDAPIGTRRVLLVDGLPYVVQATKWVQARPGMPATRGEPEFWPDGNPKWVVGVPCVDEYGQPAAWWVRRPSAAYRAVNEAQETQGIKIQRSRVVVVTYVRDEPTSGNPQKIYSVEIYDVDTAWNGLTPAQQAVYTEWTRLQTADLEDDPANTREDKQAAAAESAAAASQVPQQAPNGMPSAGQYPPQGYAAQQGMQPPQYGTPPQQYPGQPGMPEVPQYGTPPQQYPGKPGMPEVPTGPSPALAAAQQAAAARGHSVAPGAPPAQQPVYTGQAHIPPVANNPAAYPQAQGGFSLADAARAAQVQQAQAAGMQVVTQAPQQVPPGAPMTMGHDAMGPRAVPVAPQQAPAGPPAQVPTHVHGLAVDVLATLVGQPDTDLMALGYNVVDVRQAIEEAQRLGALPPF